MIISQSERKGLYPHMHAIPKTPVISRIPETPALVYAPWETFKNLYQQKAKTWSESDKRNFFLHDTRALLSSLTTPGSYCGIDVSIKENQSIPDTMQASLKNFATVYDLMKKNAFPEFLSPLIEKQIPSMHATNKLLPVLESSFIFQYEQTKASYNVLAEQIVSVQTMLAAIDLPGDTISQEMHVPGAQAITLLNLFNNAKKYGRDIRIQYFPELNTISIANTSDEPLPDNLFEPKTKGKTGNTGFGMFIAESYARMENIPIIHHSEAIADGYYISFLVKNLPKNFPDSLLVK